MWEINVIAHARLQVKNPETTLATSNRLVSLSNFIKVDKYP